MKKNKMWKKKQFRIFTYKISKGSFFWKKSKIILFQEYLFHKCKPCIFLELVSWKIILILQKCFALRLFKIAANQIECSRFKQQSVIKSLVVENCKSCEIYRRMSVVYGEANFYQRNQRNINKWAKLSKESP